MVTQTPITKHTDKSNLNLPFLGKPEPICSPIGVIAKSAPKLKRAMPKINATAQTANATVSVVVRDTNGVKLNAKTITAMGKTETADSLILCHTLLLVIISNHILL